MWPSILLISCVIAIDATFCGTFTTLQFVDGAQCGLEALWQGVIGSLLRIEHCHGVALGFPNGFPQYCSQASDNLRFPQ